MPAAPALGDRDTSRLRGRLGLHSKLHVRTANMLRSVGRAAMTSLEGLTRSNIKTDNAVMLVWERRCRALSDRCRWVSPEMLTRPASLLCCLRTSGTQLRTGGQPLCHLRYDGNPWFRKLRPGLNGGTKVPRRAEGQELCARGQWAHSARRE